MSILEERENKGILKGREEGRLEGKAEGLVEGREQAREEIALNMLKDGVSVERVAKYAELPVEKVEELQRKI